MSVISIATSLYTIKKVSSTIGWFCCLLIHTYKDLTAILVSRLFPAIRYAPRHGGNSQYCPCVCMPSQWWLVDFSFLFNDGFNRVNLKYTLVTVRSCSVVCFSKERIPYKTWNTFYFSPRSHSNTLTLPGCASCIFWTFLALSPHRNRRDFVYRPGAWWFNGHSKQWDHYALWCGFGQRHLHR